jgi:ABC-type sugar transport system ATPase subunit
MESPGINSPPLLQVDGVSKSFGGVHALEEVSCAIYRGEVTALVGNNGAGKSTLVKIISGAISPSVGRLYLRGEQRVFSSTADARRMGIETVFQHLALVEQLDVSENVFLGREVTYEGLGRFFGFLSKRKMQLRTMEVLNRLHIRIPPPRVPVRSLSGGQRQAVAIGRAVMWGKELLILDEPTAALGVEETEQVLQLIEDLKRAGHIAVIVVSHNMQDVYRIADRILVLRHGRLVADLRKGETDMQEVVAYITGALG